MQLHAPGVSTALLKAVKTTFRPEVRAACWSLLLLDMDTMVATGGDLQPVCLADRLLTGLGQHILTGIG